MPILLTLIFCCSTLLFSTFCTPPLMLSGSVTIPRLQKTCRIQAELRIPCLKRLATCPYHVFKILYNITTTQANMPWYAASPYTHLTVLVICDRDGHTVISVPCINLHSSTIISVKLLHMGRACCSVPAHLLSATGNISGDVLLVRAYTSSCMADVPAPFSATLLQSPTHPNSDPVHARPSTSAALSFHYRLLR